MLVQIVLQHLQCGGVSGLIHRIVNAVDAAAVTQIEHLQLLSVSCKLCGNTIVDEVVARQEVELDQLQCVNGNR